MLRKVDPSSSFWKNLCKKIPTLKFFTWNVEHAVVIRATTLFNLQYNNVARQIEKNVARITGHLLLKSRKLNQQNVAKKNKRGN